MTTTIYKFESGRLLVHEERTAESAYLASGLPLRIGQIRQIEKVLSIDTDYAKYGLITPLNEVLISGNTLQIVMRRGDMGTYVTSGFMSGLVPLGMSGYAAIDLMSGLASGLAWLGPLRSGAPTSGKVKVHANVIGY